MNNETYGTNVSRNPQYGSLEKRRNQRNRFETVADSVYVLSDFSYWTTKSITRVKMLYPIRFKVASEPYTIEEIKKIIRFCSIFDWTMEAH